MRRLLSSVSATRFLMVQAAPLTTVAMPSLSPTMEQGKIVEWLKQPGDKIAEGDTWCKIETDKAAVPFDNVSEEGFVARILVEAGGDPIPVGQPIALLVDEEAEIASDEVKNFKAPAAAAPAAAEPAPAAPATPAPTVAANTAASGAANLGASPPSVHRLAAQFTDDQIKKVVPSGKDGRYTKQDFIAVGDIDYNAGKALPSSPIARPEFSGSSASSSAPAAAAAPAVPGKPGAVYNFAVRDDVVLRKLLGLKPKKAASPVKAQEKKAEA